MAETSGFKGKSMKAIAGDVAEGYIAINPLFLKKFDRDMVKDLYEFLNKAMNMVRLEKVELTNHTAVRIRNMKLQRLHNAIIILRNTAREKRFPL